MKKLYEKPLLTPAALLQAIAALQPCVSGTDCL
jgi:hypothetical protein